MIRLHHQDFLLWRFTDNSFCEATFRRRRPLSEPPAAPIITEERAVPEEHEVADEENVEDQQAASPILFGRRHAGTRPAHRYAVEEEGSDEEKGVQAETNIVDDNMPSLLHEITGGHLFLLSMVELLHQLVLHVEGEEDVNDRCSQIDPAIKQHFLTCLSPNHRLGETDSIKDQNDEVHDHRQVDIAAQWLVQHLIAGTAYIGILAIPVASITCLRGKVTRCGANLEAINHRDVLGRGVRKRGGGWNPQPGGDARHCKQN